jgi:hypothetical protein
MFPYQPLLLKLNSGDSHLRHASTLTKKQNDCASLPRCSLATPLPWGASEPLQF